MFITKHLATILLASYFSLILTNNLIEGCALQTNLGTKKVRLSRALWKLWLRIGFHFHKFSMLEHQASMVHHTSPRLSRSRGRPTSGYSRSGNRPAHHTCWSGSRRACQSDS
jgi:hypothetical protein